MSGSSVHRAVKAQNVLSQAMAQTNNKTPKKADDDVCLPARKGQQTATERVRRDVHSPVRGSELALQFGNPSTNQGGSFVFSNHGRVLT